MISDFLNELSKKKVNSLAQCMYTYKTITEYLPTMLEII